MFNKYMTENYHIPNTNRRYLGQFHEFVTMEKAHGAMLVKQGLLSKENFNVICEGLTKVDNEMTLNDVDGELGDLYFNLTDQLYKRIGQETADLLHVGRSRNDMECTCNRMQIRRQILEMTTQLNNVLEVLLDFAEENLETVVTYNTFSQPAQPGTLAHYLMLCYDQLQRDFNRLVAAYKNTNRSAMGGAAGIGTGFDLDRQYESEILGFDSVIENTIDAIASNDYILETQSALAIMCVNLSKIAQDFLSWCSYEYKIVDLDASVCGGSSIMPQKKNPEVFEQMRAYSAYAIGSLNEMLSLNKNTTLFPNLEATCETVMAFDEGFANASKALGMFVEGLKAMTLDKEKSYKYTSNNFTAASTMAEVLAKKYDVPFTKTHHVIHGMIHTLMANKTMSVEYLTPELMEKVSTEVLGKPIIMTKEEVQQLADPLFCLNDKVTGGTPKPADTKKMIDSNRENLNNNKAWHENETDKIKNAYAKIEK